jgi:hypothetical protein
MLDARIEGQDSFRKLYGETGGGGIFNISFSFD